MSRLTRFLLRCLPAAVCLGALHASATAQPVPESPNLFSGFRTLQLGNGLVVWYRDVPGAPAVSLSVSVPYGSDRDFPGREELAHVLEHALFDERAGRSAEELRRAVEERGGTFNASTSPDRTFFWISTGREHALFALEWLHGVLAPRAFDEAVAARSRAAVALEIGLGPRGPAGWLRDNVLLPPALLPPRFWEREFGMSVPEYRRSDRWAALQAIGPADLEEFHRTHYVPARMVLMVVGDIDSTAVVRRLETTFGMLPAWPVPPASAAGAPRSGEAERFLWQLRPDAVYDLRFRFARPDGDDHLRLLFAERLLERRLMRRLRWGPRAASYGVTTALVQRADVAFLQVRAAVRPGELAYARGVIEDELLRLRQGRYPADEFEQDRAALALAVRQESLSPSALRAWAASAFYRPEQHPQLPDVPARFAVMESAELSALASRALAPDAVLRTVIRPVPLGELGLLALALAALGAGCALARRLLLRPAPLASLRYVARLRGPLLLRVLGSALLIVLFFVAARLVGALGHHLVDPWLFAVESFPVQAAAFLAALAIAALLAAAALALVPHKLLVFERELRLKYRAYRSRRWRAEEVVGTRSARFGDVFLTRRLLRTRALTLGLRTPGLLIELRHGRDLFVAARDVEELARVIGATLLAHPAVAEPPLQAAVSSSQPSP